LKEAGAESLSFQLLNRNVDQPLKYVATSGLDKQQLGLRRLVCSQPISSPDMVMIRTSATCHCRAKFSRCRHVEAELRNDVIHLRKIEALAKREVARMCRSQDWLAHERSIAEMRVHDRRSSRHLGLAALRHQEWFPPPRLNGRCPFS
jgi:hypothetical protein